MAREEFYKTWKLKLSVSIVSQKPYKSLRRNLRLLEVAFKWTAVNFYPLHIYKNIFYKSYNLREFWKNKKITITPRLK